MKRIYTVVATRIEDNQDLEITMKATDLWMVLSDLLEELRMKCKYGDGDTTQHEEIRRWLMETMRDRDVLGLFP